MYIDIVPNRKSPPAILLRESIRQGKKIVKRTIANLSTLSIEQAQAIRRILKNEKLVQPEAHFDIFLDAKENGSIYTLENEPIKCAVNVRPVKSKSLLERRCRCWFFVYGIEE